MDRDERTNGFVLKNVSEADEVLEEYFLSGLKRKYYMSKLNGQPH